MWSDSFPEFQIEHAAADLLERGFSDTTVEADGGPSFTRGDLVVAFGNVIGQDRYTLQSWSTRDDWSCDDWCEFLVTLDDELRAEVEQSTDPQPVAVYTTGSEPYFSWSPCDRCNCRLGGNRYDAVEHYSDGSQYDVSICEDCAALDC